MQKPTEITCWDGGEHKIIDMHAPSSVPFRMGRCLKCGTVGAIRGDTQGAFDTVIGVVAPTMFDAMASQGKDEAK